MIRNCAKTLITRCSRYKKLQCYLSTDIPQPPVAEAVTEKRGFAKAYEKFDTLLDDTKSESATFQSLLRNSKFIDLGDPEGKVVQGRIYHIVEDDLYIDFGWKFHCVCARPKKHASNYVRGAKVRLRINSLELSSKFLGFDKDLTLLEADCALLGLIQDPNT
ncbi:hypothetical protein PPYR_14431 [Photinus pyralis]|uniref:Uncharacterized protein n=1 Tax=Photinus pyralis TaxID=7054 RepID=A0A1Y1KWY7_PHOPY|nr:28S ribosomal protein S28, mitochondrial [Photinus pyralis]KAB0792472.1 hypothetical protein PPYR_14431 [Photinus pyralis]